MKMIYEMQLFLLNLQNIMYGITEEKIMTLDAFIHESGSIVITTHQHPDGDAGGSATAMWSYLRDRTGRNARIVLPDSLPPTLDFLGKGYPFLIGEDEATFDAIRRADLVIALDFNAFKRSGPLEQAFSACRGRKVLIDHHPEPDAEAFDLVFSQCNVSSASELLFHILMKMPDVDGDASALPRACAYSLMTGMTTDTNNFANSVYPSTLQMASELLAAGVDRDSIIEKVYNSGRDEKLLAWSYLLDRKMKLMDCGVAYIVLTKEEKERLGLMDGETDGLVNIPLQIGRIRVSALLTEEDGHFRVSLRSKKDIAINVLAKEKFNGGGHPQASGGKIFIPEEIEDSSKIAAYFEETAARYMHDSCSATTDQ